jgi:hypothetical protein
MTPKEKAKQLIQKFELIDREQRYQDELNLFEAKQCTLICVDEILEIIRYHGTDIGKHSLKYWLDVKQEISLL